MTGRLNNKWEPDAEEFEEENDYTEVDPDEGNEIAEAEVDEGADDEGTDDQDQAENVDALRAQVQKANNESRRRRQQNKELRKEATVREEALLALVDAGVPAQKLRRAHKALDSGTLDLADDGTVTGVEEAISALRADVPEFFSSEEQEPTPPLPNPLTLPGNGSKHNSPKSRGESKEIRDKNLIRKYAALRGVTPGPKRGRR